MVQRSPEQSQATEQQAGISRKGRAKNNLYAIPISLRPKQFSREALGVDTGVSLRISLKKLYKSREHGWTL